MAVEMVGRCLGCFAPEGLQEQCPFEKRRTDNATHFTAPQVEAWLITFVDACISMDAECAILQCCAFAAQQEKEPRICRQSLHHQFP
ncbi:hypothetical protein TSMEX_006832 [Taenia solium]|eukprot:TsM_001066800 transcript=TsM_001066800 gene=TsM_001066800